MRALFSALLVIAAGCSTDPAPPPSSGADATAADASRPDASSILDASGPSPLACDPAFGAASACGGDLAGEWRFIAVCGAPDAITDFLATCPAARFVQNEHTVTGTAGFGADGRYGWYLRDDFAAALEVPASCTDSVGGCNGFALVVGIGLGQAVTCAERGDSCDCTTTGTEEDRQQGTWAAITGTITTTRSDGRARSYHYCVAGERASYKRTDDGIVFLIER